MPDRLSALDSSVLYMEHPTTPLHVGSVAIFRLPADGFGYERFVELIGRRLPLLPRYRQRVVGVPGHLARPVWVDDVDFDVHYHVRRSALPTPGTDEQLFELVGRLFARPLVTERPLWEAYLVEGLQGDRFALVTKTHQAMIDGTGTIDLAQLILAPDPPEQQQPRRASWAPHHEPGSARLLFDAAREVVSRPGAFAENLRSTVKDAAVVADGIREMAVARSARSAPLHAHTSTGRLFAVLRTALDDYSEIRQRHGATLEDVILAVLAGGLREWLLSRQANLRPEDVVRALVPMRTSVTPTEGSWWSETFSDLGARLVELPVGEANPVLRLRHVVRDRTAGGSQRVMGASLLLWAGGFAPATLHALGARAAGAFSGRIFDVLVTSSPGPQEPLYVDDARMQEMFPVMPLARSQVLAVGATSYAGSVFFGLNADRKAMSDVDALAEMLESSLAELRGVNR